MNFSGLTPLNLTAQKLETLTSSDTNTIYLFPLPDKAR